MGKYLNKFLIILIIVGIVFIIMGISLMIIDIFVNYKCYQLQPNDLYNSTICEKYWRR